MPPALFALAMQFEAWPRLPSEIPNPEFPDAMLSTSRHWLPTVKPLPVLVVERQLRNCVEEDTTKPGTSQLVAVHESKMHSIPAVKPPSPEASTPVASVTEQCSTRQRKRTRIPARADVITLQ